MRIWFTKTGEASYISLLDLQRVMSRSIKRSGVPAWYTLGFNPHIYMTFACPLPLGQESLVESVDFKTEDEHPDLEAWKQALNRVMPSGISVTKVCPVQMKADEIAFAGYSIRYPAGMLTQAVAHYNELPQVPVEKKTKRGLKTIDLKEYIPTLTLLSQEGKDVLELKLPAGVSFTVNPALLTGFFARECGVKESDGQILRTAIFTKSMENFC